MPPSVVATLIADPDQLRLSDAHIKRAAHVTEKQPRLEYHPASDSDAAETPDDIFAADLASRKLAVPEP